MEILALGVVLHCDKLHSGSGKLFFREVLLPCFVQMSLKEISHTH